MGSQNYLKLALDAYQKRSFQQAEHWLSEALRVSPDSPELHAWQCEVLRSQGRLQDAQLAAGRALRLDPDHADALYNLAVVLLAAGREVDALARLEALVAAHPAHAPGLHNLGVLLERRGQARRALACYEAAIATGRAVPATQASLAALLVELGDHDRARQLYAARLTNNPDDVEAHFAYSRLTRYQPGMEQLASLEALAAKRDLLPWQAAAKVGFALGKARQDVGEHQAALQAFVSANDLHYRHRPYAEGANHALLEDVMQTINASLLARLTVDEKSALRPVFILGMPRSGSTLLEQMLLAHGDFASGGELKHLKAVIQSHLVRDRGTIGRAAGVWTGQDFRAAASDYIGRLAGHGYGKSLVIDKMPGNFAFIGLIAALFPNAIILHTIRHPLAVMWSAYSTHFADGLHYTYEIGTLARFHSRYRQVMGHWEQVLPRGRIIPVVYEKLVAEPELVLRGLMERLGLPWRPTMLEFHRGSHPVRTASVAQVRQPLHGAAVDLWRHYEHFLAPYARGAGLA